MRRYILAASCLACCLFSVGVMAHPTKSLSVKRQATLSDDHVRRFTAGGVTVTTTPFLGMRDLGDDADLLFDMASINQDVRLLAQHQHFMQRVRQVGGQLNQAVIGLSGGLEGELVSAQDHITQHSHGDMDLSTAELDVGVLVSPWASGFMSLNYDSASPNTGSRVENSRLYMRRGFLVIGNLDKTPFYLSAGQMYAPFGRYRSTMLTTPLTRTMGRVLKRMVVVGHHTKHLNIAAYGYHSDISKHGDASLNQFGLNARYEGDWQRTHWVISGSFISNIADSQGMLDNGLPAIAENGGAAQFDGFGGEKLAQSVPGVGLDVAVSFKKLTLIGEWIGVTHRFDASDLTFNSKAARPESMHLELDYATHFWGKSATVGVAYGRSWQALGLNMPKTSVAIIAKMVPWKNTLLGIAFRHDHNYSASSTATGLQGNALHFVTDCSNGGDRNIVSVLLGVYF